MTTKPSKSHARIAADQVISRIDSLCENMSPTTYKQFLEYILADIQPSIVLASHVINKSRDDRRSPRGTLVQMDGTS